MAEPRGIQANTSDIHAEIQRRGRKQRRTDTVTLPRAVVEQVVEALRGLMPFNVAGNCFYCDLGVPRDAEFLHGDSQFPDEPRCLHHEYYDDERAALAALEEAVK